MKDGIKRENPAHKQDKTLREKLNSYCVLLMANFPARFPYNARSVAQDENGRCTINQISLAGTPATLLFAGTSEITTAPAAARELAPMRIS